MRVIVLFDLKYFIKVRETFVFHQKLPLVLIRLTMSVISGSFGSIDKFNVPIKKKIYGKKQMLIKQKFFKVICFCCKI
jgi:hypothetical protein